MIKKLLINGKLINEDEIREADVLIEDQRISRIEPSLSAGLADEVIDLQGRYLLPGLIDDQVHFREPGLTHKGSLATESKAAIVVALLVFLKCLTLVLPQRIEPRCLRSGKERMAAAS